MTEVLKRGKAQATRLSDGKLELRWDGDVVVKFPEDVTEEEVHSFGHFLDRPEEEISDFSNFVTDIGGI